MPLPKPSGGETKDGFMARCMANDTMKNEFPEGDQRYAVCQAQWDDGKKKGESMIKAYPRIAKALYQSPWMILPPTHANLVKQFEAHMAQMPMEPMDDEEDDDEMEETMEPMNKPKTALISVDGIIGKHLGLLETMCGGIDLDIISELLDEVSEDEEVENVVLYFNTPGGTVTGVPEIAEKIAELAKKKRCIAYADMLCASAGYYMASQCNAIYAAPSAEIGSVGVYALYLDESRALENAGIKVNPISAGKYKLMGAPFKPMDDEERAMLQKDVDRIYTEFKKAVTSKRQIVDEDLQGQVFDGVTAVEKGFVDGNIFSLKELLSALENN